MSDDVNNMFNNLVCSSKHKKKLHMWLKNKTSELKIFKRDILISLVVFLDLDFHQFFFIN